MERFKKITISILSTLAFLLVCVFLGLYGTTEETDTVEMQDMDICMDFLCKDIYIDGVLVNNYQLQSAFLTHRDKVYVPLTEEMGKAMGFTAEYNAEEDVLTLSRTAEEGSGEGCFYHLFGWDLGPGRGVGRATTKLYVTSCLAEERGKEARSFKAGSAEEWDLPLEEQFYSEQKGCWFIPLYVFAESEAFPNISFCQDKYTGVYISTKEDIPAEQYLEANANNESFIKGRVEYITGCNPYVDEDTAIYYEYLFRHEAVTRQLDEDLLIAMTKGESCFTADDISHTGAIGLMQIQPASARANNWDPETLYDPHLNLEFGSMYIRDKISIYGSVELALVAYYWGSVNREKLADGTLDRTYSNYILNIYNGIHTIMDRKGCSNIFNTTIVL